MNSDWRAYIATRSYCSVPPPPHPTYNIQKVVQHALEEDAAGIGDITTQATVSECTQAKAEFLCKADGVVAGLGVAAVVVQQVDPAVQLVWLVEDGEEVCKGQVLGHMEGPAAAILVAERVILNFMQRMSGIATQTRQMVTAMGAHRCTLLESRKTVPGLRLLDKWAVLLGGGRNHRMGLYDMMMIKDNHITAAGGIARAVERAQQYIEQKGLQGVGVEVETRTLEEVDEVVGILDGGRGACITRVMLDNMTRDDPAAESGIDISMLQEAVNRLGGRVETEASGGITLETAGRVASSGVTYLSCGALTHSVKALDISLNIVTL